MEEVGVVILKNITDGIMQKPVEEVQNLKLYRSTAQAQMA